MSGFAWRFQTATCKRTLATTPAYVYDTYAAADGKLTFKIVPLYHSTIFVAAVDGMTVMKSRILSFVMFVALSLQATHVNAQDLPCLTCPKVATAINTINTITDVSDFFDNASLSRTGPKKIATGILDSFKESKASLPEGKRSYFFRIHLHFWLLFTFCFTLRAREEEEKNQKQFDEYDGRRKHNGNFRRDIYILEYDNCDARKSTTFHIHRQVFDICKLEIIGILVEEETFS